MERLNKPPLSWKLAKAVVPYQRYIGTFLSEWGFMLVAKSRAILLEV